MSEQDRRRIVALQEDNIKLIDEAERTRAEAARYRAALEEIRRRARGIRENGGLCPTGSPYLDGRMWAWQEAGMIANRALHPEGTD